MFADTLFKTKKSRTSTPASTSTPTSGGTPYAQLSSGPLPVTYHRDVISPPILYEGMPPPRARDSDAGSIRSMASSTSMLPNRDLGRYPSFTESRQPRASEDFTVVRPPDAQVEAEFQRLLDERELVNPRTVPSISSRQSISSMTDVSKSTASLTVDQKWQMLKADAQARQTRSDDKKSGVVKNSPEWFLRKILDGSVTVQHMATLFVSLRTMPLE